MKNIGKTMLVKVLTYIAKLVLLRHKPRVVAVCGSVGKTSTKDAVAAVLSSTASVQKSKKSYNSEFGIPLAIIGAESGWGNVWSWVKVVAKGVGVLLKNEYPEWLILEVGVDRPGDMDALNKWLSVNVLIFTRLPKVPVHVEYFSSPEEVAKEKLKIVQALVPGGVFIYNTDDENLAAFVSDKKVANVLSYGTEDTADVSCSKVTTLYKGRGKKKQLKGTTFTVAYHDQKTEIEALGVVGSHSVFQYLAAIACGTTVGMSLSEMVTPLEGLAREPGRMSLMEGNKNSVIIDDSYNSSPIALASAMMTVRDLKMPGRKIAVLGDMAELGKYSKKQHVRAGEAVAVIFDMLITVGKEARHIAEGALHAGMDEAVIFQYESPKLAGKELDVKLEEGDVVLVKGSQSVRLEKVVEEIMAEPSRKQELLARQDEAWRYR